MKRIYKKFGKGEYLKNKKTERTLMGIAVSCNVTGDFTKEFTRKSRICHRGGCPSFTNNPGISKILLALSAIT